MAKNTSHSRAFFFEMVANLMMFALCAAVCLQIFAQAHIKSRLSQELSQASLKAQVVAELFKSEGGDVPKMAALCGGKAQGNEALAVYYDKNWAPVPEAEAAFVLRCDVEDGGSLRTAGIGAYRLDGGEIISITAMVGKG